MTFNTARLRFSCLYAAFATAFAIFTGVSANAQSTIHPLTGNLRFQIGEGLPFPITFAAAPNGAVQAVSGAHVSQATGPDPRAIAFAGDEFHHTPIPIALPVYLLGGPVFQVMTSIGVTYPLVSAVLEAGGRTGAATVSYCIGSTVPPTGNPGCVGPGAGTGSLPGIMIYTKSAAQFGGPLAGRIFGIASVALNGGGTAIPPCAGPQCKVLMVTAKPISTGSGNIGSVFAGTATSPGVPLPTGLFTAAVNAAGIITSLGAGIGPGIPNPAIQGGGPWTTGMVTVSQTAALAGDEIFMLTGFDARVSGVGTISLVAGGLSSRATSGPNANRGWLNLVIGPAVEIEVPSISAPIVAALAVLLSVAGGLMVRRRTRD